ncbi:MAG: tetratricopeptide repeat protein [Planctomycetaceae bacterium]
MFTLGAEEADQSQVRSSTTDQPQAIKYIGSEQCVTCHREQQEGFAATLHHKTARLTDVALEPPPAAFIHEASGHRYEVEVANGKMFHSEQRRSVNGDPIGVTKQQVTVTLGSGENSTSYLSRIGQFHIESPITYFNDVKRWSMSPGYEAASHLSFRRAVSVGCVFCHVGSIKQFDHNPYKFEIVETKISCERCHGPGELHLKRHQASASERGRASLDRSDDTIVNPQALSRELSEAICQQCHCQGAVELPVAGRGTWDFRPGRRLTDYRVDFQFGSTGDDSMSLVGHVEQLHQSKCYTETTTLTCITCHDPHHSPDQDKSVQYHREKCIQCHKDESCGEEHETRLLANGNDCSACHMPRRETNVAHFALRNHRIGIHSQTSQPTDSVATNVSPILDISHLPPAEQRRLKSLAKYELFRRRGGDPKFAALMDQATSELIALKNEGVANADVDAALVWLAWEQGQAPIAESIARDILARDQGETEPRIVATHTLARILLDRKEYASAISLYRSLEKMHRDSSHSYFLGLAEQNNGNSAEAIHALKRSLEIDPSQLAAYRALQVIHESLGQPELAKKYADIAEQNELLNQPH